MSSAKASSNNIFDELQFVRKLAASLRSPLSGLFRHVRTIEDYDNVVSSHPINPASYHDAWSFGGDYILSKVLTKFYEEDGAKEKLDAATFEKFLSVEARVAETNERFRMLTDPSFVERNARVVHNLLCMQRKIEEAFLKEGVSMFQCPLEPIMDLCAFSSGASFRKARRHGCTPAHKFEANVLDCTKSFLPLGEILLSYYRGWKEIAGIESFDIVPGNRITTVPKNRKINRTIAVEPTLNMYFQKGLGNFMRKILKRHCKINLDDQSINQRLAWRGSLEANPYFVGPTECLATLDLSSASDSVALEAVRFLFPHSFFVLLDISRSQEGTLPSGETVTYEKISSMGNGFTFELESFIFWAACASVCSEGATFSVYGDDIIVPARHVPELVELLSFLGFTLNEEKSFTSGPFRESCGKHYFHGEDVTPVFHRSNGSHRLERISRLILLANNLRRWMGRTGRALSLGDDSDIVRVHRYITQCLPEFWQKPRIPEGVGDGALIGTLAEVQPSFDGMTYTAIVLQQRCREAKVKPSLGLYIQSIARGVSQLQTEVRSSKDLRQLGLEFKRCELISQSFESLDPSLMSYRTERIRLWSWSDPSVDDPWLTTFSPSLSF